MEEVFFFCFLGLKAGKTWNFLENDIFVYSGEDVSRSFGIRFS